MIRLVALFFLLIFIVFPYKVHTQEFTYALFDTQDGLPSATITAIAEDKAGRLWIGTDAGLVRYNGYEFQDFYDNPTYHLGKVNTLAVDSSGRIWVGNNAGLSVFSDNAFHPITNEGLDSTSIQRLIVNQNQEVFIATNNHLFEIKGIHEDSLHVVRFDVEGVLDITEGLNGEILLGTTTGLKQVINHNIEPVIDDEDINHEDIVDILPYKEGLLIGTSEENVYNFRSTDRHLEMTRPYADYYHDFVSFEKWDSQIWFVYGWSILCQTDSGERIIRYPEQWNIKYVNTSFIDQENNLWLGSTEGLIRIRKSAFSTIEHTQIEYEIYSMMEDRSHTIWLGSNHGIVYQWSKFGIIEWEMPEDFDGEVIDIIQDVNDNVWIASFWKGLVKVSNEEMIRFHETDIAESGPDIYDLHLDPDLNLWIGTYRGLFVKERERDNFISCDTLGIPDHCDVYQIKHGSSGLWVGSSCGLYHWDNDKFRLMTLPELSSDNPIRSLLIDQEFIWIGTTGFGLRCYTFSNDRLHLQKVIDHPDRIIFDVVVDADYIWAGTPRHLLKIDRDSSMNYQVFTNQDGFFDQGYAYLKLLVDHNRDLFITTSKGIKKLVAKTKPERPKKALFLDQLIVDGAVMDSLESEINLPSNTQVIEVDYYYPQLSGTELLNYQWRMSTQQEWSDWSKTREINLYNPKPGSYHLEIRAKDENQILSHRTIHFVINQPWYQIRYLQILILLLFVGGLYYFIKKREKGNKLKHELETQRAMTMASLESRALRAQMNPHFLFNILNNLQEMIISGETQLAQIYLNKFSRLMRMILNLSAKEYVRIEEETEFLELYLDLEQLRFDDQLKISIEIDPELSTAEIPVFMVQPLLENAIRHGLRPKVGEKKLALQIDQYQSFIRILVKDNGRGLTVKTNFNIMEKSKRINALHLIEQRLQILSQSSGIDCKITLRESKNGDGVESELLLPL